MVRQFERIRAPKIPSDVLKYETSPEISRETATLLGGVGGERAVEIGTVLGRVGGAGTATGTPVAGNTGNGALNVTPATASGVKAGVYKIVVLEAAANGGEFIVEDPDGVTLGTGVVGSAFSKGGLTFTLADGATDFAEGDSFTISVVLAGGAPVLKELNFEATDGSQNVYGVAIRDTTATEDTNLVNGLLYVRRLATLADSGLIWPEDATEAQKSRGIAQLEALNLIVRQAV